MNYRLFFIIAILISALSLPAQNTVDRSNYKLLWEITGNGFEKPSYLFGSMHVEDERVFEFCDSMLICLESCEGFSGELNMDSMVYFVMKAMFSEDTTNILRDILSPEAYEGLNNKLLNKEGKNIDDLNNKQPWIIDMMLDDDAPESESDFESFLDMYLYNYAKKLGKETYGLEKIEDQLSLSLLKYETYQEYLADMNKDDKSGGDANDVLEQLTQIYISGDIDVIDDIFVKPMPDDIYKQKLLTDRNIVMADNIEQLGQEMSMFNVVGAAHLPGETGVIELLRKKGFSLRQVSPDFTGKSQFKDLSHVELPWKELDRRIDMECVMSFPTDAVKIENIEGEDMSEFDYYMSMDLNTQQLYMYLGIDVQRDLGETEIRHILDMGLQSVLEQEGTKAEVLAAPYDIDYKGMKGRAAKVKNSDGVIEARGFAQGSKMYYLYVFSEKGDVENVQRFFNSLKFYPSKIEEVEGTVVRKDYALSFEAPVSMSYTISEKYQLNSNNERYPYPSIMHEYEGKDEAKDVFYSVLFYDMPEGMYTTNENAVLNAMVERMETFGMNKLKEGDKEILSKINRKEYLFEKEGMFTSIGYFLRGSRFINVFVAAGSEKISQQEYERFVSSIYLLDFKKTAFSTQKIEEAGISIKMPGNSQKKYKDYESYPYDKPATQLTATDTSSTATFLLEVVQLSPYYEIENKDTFLLNLQETMAEDAEEVKHLEFFQRQGYPSIKFDLFDNRKTTVITQMQITLVEDELIYVVAHLPRELYNTEYSNAFFNSLEIDTSFERTKSVENKINLIAEDLATTDDATYDKLQNVIYNYEVKARELPVIYTILEKEIPLDTSSVYYYSVKELFIMELGNTHDEHTIPFLEKIFATSTMKEQLAILNTIGKIEGKQPEKYWELMERIDAEDEDFSSYRVIQHFYEDLPAVIENIDKIMSLSEKSIYTNNVYALILTMTNEPDLQWKEAILPYRKDMLVLLKNKFSEWKSNGRKADSDLVSLLQYLIIIQSEFRPNEELYAFLEKNIIDTKGYLSTQMAGALLENNISLDKEIWSRIEKEHLIYAVVGDVLNEYYEYQYHPLIPKKYKNQTYAAKIGLVAFFEDDHNVDDVKFIRKEKIEKGEEAYNLYVFEMTDKYYQEEKVIGVSVQPANKKEYQFYPFYYNYDFYEDGFDLEESIEALMQSFFK